MSQANAAPITGECTIVGDFSANLPDMSAGNIADASPSRRSMLAGLLAASVGGSALLASAAVGAPTKGEATMNMHSTMLRAACPSEWKDALTRYRVVDAAWNHFLETVYNPAVSELERRCPLPPKEERCGKEWEQKWLSERRQIESEIRFRKINLQDDLYSTELHAARDRLIAAQVQDAAELLEKMEVLWEEGVDADAFKKELFRDVRSLASA